METVMQDALMQTDPLHRFTLLQSLVLTVPAFVIMAYYFRRALSVGRFTAIVFVLAIAYGMAIELFDIKASEAYFYTDLRLMIGSPPNWVPLFIGVCWGGILWAAMETSDRLQLPAKTRPIFDGALGLSLDLVLDPVASNSAFVSGAGITCSDSSYQFFGGVGLWSWCIPEHGAHPLWFSVPVPNFIAWFMVLALASAAVRIIRGPLHAESRHVVTQVLMLIAGFVLAAIGLVVGLSILLKIVTSSLGLCIVLGVLVLAPVMLLLVYRRHLNFSNPLDAGLLLFPAYIVVWEVGTYIVAGIDRASWPQPLLVLIAAAAFSVLLWLAPYLKRRRTPAPQARRA
jgi:hypothetical protein